MKDGILNKSEVLDIVVGAISSKFGERIKGYSSPLDSIIDDIVLEQSEEIRKISKNVLSQVIKDSQFKKDIKTEFRRKIAKSMVAKLEGSVEKAVEVLRQTPQLRAEMILAIEKIIKEK